MATNTRSSSKLTNWRDDNESLVRRGDHRRFLSETAMGCSLTVAHQILARHHQPTISLVHRRTGQPEYSRRRATRKLIIRWTDGYSDT